MGSRDVHRRGVPLRNGHHYARWIEFVEGIDPWAGHSDTPPDFDPFEQHYDGSSMEQQR
jgi:hypothetical protein